MASDAPSPVPTDAAPPPPQEPPALEAGSGRALLRERDYLLFWASRFIAVLGVQIESVTLGWQVYALARRTMSVPEASLWVGMIGLAAFFPVLLLTLPAGQTADSRDRRGILLSSYAVEISTAAVLMVATLTGHVSIALLLGAAAVFGAARAFFSPASTAMGPMLVPRHLLPRAIAWNSLAWQSASILGPALGGLLIAASPAAAYGASFAFYAVAAVLVVLIRKPTRPAVHGGSRMAMVQEGLAYVWNNKIVFGAISLDLFAVLLGGATALLPVFARDVLHVGPEGFGVLRAGPAMGATVVAVWLAWRPIRRRAGVTMFLGVAAFALATIVFAVSRNMWLSVAALACLGGADMLSVFVRQTLVQLVTPDAMRGRVGAVSSLFIGASNELGEFETGVVSRLLGPVNAALFGGIGALGVTGLWAWMFPALRKADRLE